MAADRRVERVRLTLMIVIAWLVGAAVYDVMREAVNASIGFVAAALAVGVSVYTRRRVAIRAEHKLSAHFWSFLPLAIFIAVPAVVKIVTYLRDDKGGSWSDHLYALAPLALKLGVPVALLLWVYLLLGRVSFADRKASEGETENE